MHKLNLTVCALALSVASFAGHAASGGTVTFNGELIADTCEVDTASEDRQVTLPTLSVQKLATAGQVDGSTTFDINVINCDPSITNVGVHYEAIGTNFNPATGSLLNTAPVNSAGNVEVALFEIDGTSISVGQSGATIPVAAGGATVKGIGAYRATAATTPGLVTAQVVYNLHYN